MPSLSLHTPLGALTVSQENEAIVSLDWGWGRDQTPTPLLMRAAAQLQAYFDGSLHRFDLPLAPRGTPYRQRVWAALQDIAYGQTCSYATLARRAGGSARSIGGANGANPIPIIIPCHRVVGAAGIGGYSGGEGVQTKSWLLAHEAPAAQQPLDFALPADRSKPEARPMIPSPQAQRPLAQRPLAQRPLAQRPLAQRT
jgi:methylated-DNA-[protein]-cysteine S-methyltransferase